MPLIRLNRAATILAWLAGVPVAAQSTPSIPVIPGLTIVKAISNPDADYETLVQVEKVDSTAIHLLVRFPPREARQRGAAGRAARNDDLRTHRRTVRRVDMAGARHYQLRFSTQHPVEFPGTTAYGTSAAVIRDLRNKGEAAFALGSPGRTGSDAEVAYLEKLGTRGFVIRRVETVLLPVLVNSTRVTLAAIHARGEVANQPAEFWFLDDPANPIALKWTIGAQRLQVTAISFPAREETARIAAALDRGEPVEVHGIYFDTGSDSIQPESRPALETIARILAGNPGLRISVEGHTDSIGGTQYNLELSRARAEAVRRVLIDGYGIDAERLTASGYGASRPRETNSTLEGRARNRRVEVVRKQPH